MRYAIKAKVIPEKAATLKQALADGSFGRDFPFGDLGDNLRDCIVDENGTLRWIETCYCREYSQIAMVMELEYFECYLHAIEIGDARDPRFCKGYPYCNDCDCTRSIRYEGIPLAQYLDRLIATDRPDSAAIPTRWTGWRGVVQTAEEAQRNEKAPSNAIL